MVKGLGKFYTRDYLRHRKREGATIEEDHRYLDEFYVDTYGEIGSPLDKIEFYGYEHGGWTSKSALKKLEQKTKYMTKDEREHMIQHVNERLMKTLELKQMKLKTGQVVYRNKLGKFASLQASDEQIAAIKKVELDSRETK